MSSDKDKSKEQLIQELQKIKRKNNQLENRLHFLKHRESILIEKSPGILIYLDNNYHYIFANQEFARRFNLDLKKIKGKTCYKYLWGRSTPCPDCPLPKTIKAEKEVVAEVQRGDMTIFSKSVPVTNNNGEITSVLFYGFDITERKQAEKELEENKQRLDLAMDAGEHAFWDWNLDTDEIYFSPMYYKMLGYEYGELPMEKDTWVNLMHPEDRRKFIPKVEKYVKGAQSYEVEFRLKCKDGSWKWILGSGKNFDIDKEGISHRAVGVHVDIHRRKQRIKQLQEQKEELSAANQQLTAYSEEITAMNEELDDSIKQVNELNKRFVNMINIVSSLDRTSKYDKDNFLSELLRSAIDIVPESDYGKICIIDEEDKCRFIDTVGHDFKLLKETKIRKELFFHHEDKGIYTSEDYSLDIEKVSESMKEIFKKSLKPISKSIYINIIVDNQVRGRISLDIAEDSNKEFSKTTKHILESFSTLASTFFSFQLYNKLQGKFTKELIGSIVQMLGMYDSYTTGHSESVGQIAANISEEMGLSQKEIENTYWAGMVHDIGKLLIPLNILNKEEALTDDEYQIIQKHPYWGFRTLSRSESLRLIAKYVLHHHERWDGKGYPKGLKGEEIPLISQILAVADAWDAMTSKRAYRNPLSEDKALQEIKDNIGKQFSPIVAKSFLNIIKK